MHPPTNESSHTAAMKEQMIKARSFPNETALGFA